MCMIDCTSRVTLDSDDVDSHDVDYKNSQAEMWPEGSTCAAGFGNPSSEVPSCPPTLVAITTTLATALGCRLPAEASLNAQYNFGS